MSSELDSRIFYREPNAILYCGHVLDVLKDMPDESVDCVMTSPPYWGLRTYKTEPIVWGEDHCEHEWERAIIKTNTHHAGETNPGKEFYTKDAGQWSDNRGNFCLKCGAWKGELGLEPSIELYIDHLLQIFDEIKRVLKESGTCFVDIDDSYNSTKSLCLIPERFVAGMVDRGWILRNRICWHKTNPMPESVRDRFTSSWEPVYFFTKNQKYWFEQQFEPQSPVTLEVGKHYKLGSNYHNAKKRAEVDEGYEFKGDSKGFRKYDVGGRNKRDVWQINTQAFSGAHFAVFPEKLCETPILAGCPSQICVKCGKPREKIYVIKPMKIRRSNWGNNAGVRTATSGTMLEPNERIDLGYSVCGCENPEYEPGVVLDPFAGSGTTLMVAKRLGRKSIGIELNPEYCKLAVERISHQCQGWI